MAADVVAVLDALGVDQAHVMGLSMGGMIVQTLAIEHPGRLRSMTSVMSTTGEPDVGQSSPEARARLFGAAGDRPRLGHRQPPRRPAHLGQPGLVDEEEQARNAGEAYDRGFDPAGVGRQIWASRRAAPRADASARVPVSDAGASTAAPTRSSTRAAAGARPS